MINQVPPVGVGEGQVSRCCSLWPKPLLLEENQGEKKKPQNCKVNSRMDRLAWMQQPKSGSIEVGIGIMSESLIDTAALTAPERDNMHFLSSYRMRAATCSTPECIIAVAAQVQPYAPEFLQ